jgi:hypothetical protein
MEKKTYISPKIELIALDKDISLQLESNPPAGPEEGSLSPRFMPHDPYKATLG